MFSPRYRPERWIKILAVPLHYHQEKRLSLQPWGHRWVEYVSQYLNFWHQFFAETLGVPVLRSCVYVSLYAQQSRGTPPWCCFRVRSVLVFRNGIEKSNAKLFFPYAKDVHGKTVFCAQCTLRIWLRCSQVFGAEQLLPMVRGGPGFYWFSASNLCTLQQQLSSHCSCWCWYSKWSMVFALHGHCSWLFLLVFALYSAPGPSVVIVLVLAPCSCLTLKAELVNQSPFLHACFCCACRVFVASIFVYSWRRLHATSINLLMIILFSMFLAVWIFSAKYSYKKYDICVLKYYRSIPLKIEITFDLSVCSIFLSVQVLIPSFEFSITWFSGWYFLGMLFLFFLFTWTVIGNPCLFGRHLNYSEIILATVNDFPILLRTGQWGSNL